MPESEYPEYSEDAVLGSKGRRLVENIIHDSLGWIFREIARDDLGIDGLVEVLRDDRKSRGRLFGVQIKCGHSYLAESTESGYVYRGKAKHLKYWTEFSLSVVLILCNPDTGACYWVQVTPANIERTGAGWKVVVPFSQTLDAAAKWKLAMVVETPQPDDLIPLALYRLLIEKFPKIVIAQELETPHDFWGFEFLADLGDDLLLVTHLYKPTERFAPADIDEILRKRDICAKACGWDTAGPIPKIFLFFVAHTTEQLRLSPELKAHMAGHDEINYYRAICSFSYGVSVSEVDANDEHISMYERPRHDP